MYSLLSNLILTQRRLIFKYLMIVEDFPPVMRTAKWKWIFSHEMDDKIHRILFLPPINIFRNYLISIHTEVWVFPYHRCLYMYLYEFKINSWNQNSSSSLNKFPMCHHHLAHLFDAIVLFWATNIFSFTVRTVRA